MNREPAELPRAKASTIKVLRLLGSTFPFLLPQTHISSDNRYKPMSRCGSQGRECVPKTPKSTASHNQRLSPVPKIAISRLNSWTIGDGFYTSNDRFPGCTGSREFCNLSKCERWVCWSTKLVKTSRNLDEGEM